MSDRQKEVHALFDAGIRSTYERARIVKAVELTAHGGPIVRITGYHRKAFTRKTLCWDTTVGEGIELARALVTEPGLYMVRNRFREHYFIVWLDARELEVIEVAEESAIGLAETFDAIERETRSPDEQRLDAINGQGRLCTIAQHRALADEATKNPDAMVEVTTAIGSREKGALVHLSKGDVVRGSDLVVAHQAEISRLAGYSVICREALELEARQLHTRLSQLEWILAGEIKN